MRLLFFPSFFIFFLSSLTYAQSPQTRTKNIVNTMVADTTFVNLSDYSDAFIYDMKYATEDNFLKSKVYDCAACLLRLKTVKALVKVNEEFMKKGYRIKIFDCYRPLDIQKKMWAIVPDPKYVADPAKGSIHNRGGAVDITLVTLDGQEVEMGTSFDFFGQEAGHGYPFLDKKFMDNRKLLRKIMKKNGFVPFDSEWWHYSLSNASKDAVANTKWKCN